MDIVQNLYILVLKMFLTFSPVEYFSWNRHISFHNLFVFYVIVIRTRWEMRHYFSV